MKQMTPADTDDATHSPAWETCEHDSLSVICPHCNLQFMIKPPLLDTEHLTEIEALEAFRPGLREQMLTFFVDSARASLRACDSAWQANDRNDLEQAAHRLKGSAASLGAIRLSTLAGQLEKDAGDEADAIIHVHRLSELDAVLEETVAAYEQWLGVNINPATK